MKIIGIIPARYASSRFPGKPLTMINGKTMIRRVYEQALKCKELSKVIIATDDLRIANHIKTFGGEVILTSSKHKSGTDRCAEAIQKLKTIYQAVINIQGDEPYINPKQISQVANKLKNKNVQIATLIKKTTDELVLSNPNCVKVVFDKNLRALYFSRAAVPFTKNSNRFGIYIHIGIYGYRTDILKKITQLPVSPLEQTEMLEQLRWIENGYSIHVEKTGYNSVAIDTPEDLFRLKKIKY